MLKLHDYQEEARGHLHRNPRAALFLDMGLGKTATVLSSLTPEHLPALVTAPKRVAEVVWPTERNKWRPDLSIQVAMGDPAKRARVLDTPADITVISRDNLADAVGRTGYRTLVLDESSGFKDQGTSRWKTAKKLMGIPHLWELTGSPSPNGLEDLWAPTYLMDSGARLGRTITSFRQQYFWPGRRISTGQVVDWDLKPGADELIHAKLEDICLSMSAEGRVDVQKPIINRIEVPMLPVIRAQYKELKRELLVDMELLGGVVHTAGNAAILTNRLDQLIAGFMYEDDGTGVAHYYHREKVRALEEVVAGTGSPVLVFYRFAPERDAIREAMPRLVHTIDEPGIMDKWDRKEVPVLLVHPQAVGHGLNLQYGGHTAVWATLPWSLEEWDQANARLARQGQTEQVIIHLLVTPRSVDDAKQRRLIEKAEVQDALLDHLQSPL